MGEKMSAEALARLWIACWNEGRPDDIPLAEDFKHTSPFGCVEGRKEYLEWVKPLAATNVAELRIVRALERGDEAVIHFEMNTPGGFKPACDWIVTRGDEIVEIHSFYDASGMRKS